MLIEALKYPSQDEGAAKKIAITTLLTVFSFLLIPLILLLGYVVRTVRHGSEGKSLPGFSDPVSMFLDGLKLAAVSLIYFGLVMIAGLIATLLEPVSSGLAIAAFTAAALLYFSIALASFSILRHFSANGSIREALNFREVLGSVLTWNYAKILLSVLIVQIGFASLQILLAITVIGLLIVPVTFAYEALVVSKLASEVE